MRQREERPRVQLYAEGAVGQLLDGIPKHFRSRRLAVTSERYLALCRHEMPTLADDEWEILTFYLFGVPLTTEVLQELSATVQAASLITPFRRKVAGGKNRLLRRLDAMSFGQRVALAETLEQRWKIWRQKRWQCQFDRSEIQDAPSLQP